MTDKPEVTLTVRLPRQLATRLDRATIAYDLTPGEMVRRALEGHLDGLDHDASLPGHAEGAVFAAADHVTQ